MADTDPPNLGLLIKLLKLTTSSSDAEALSAMRKANEQLAKFGGCWERLLTSHVTVIGDPFVGIATPPPRAPISEPPRPPRTAPPRTAPPPPPPRGPRPAKPRGGPALPNRYDGVCILCKKQLSAGEGLLRRDPKDTRWEVTCKPGTCNPKPVPTKGPKPRPGVGDLLNSIDDLTPF